MYTLYFWYAWGMGRWVEKGRYLTKRAALDAVYDKRNTTFKIEKDGVVVHYCETSLWRYGMVRPPLPKNIKEEIEK